VADGTLSGQMGPVSDGCGLPVGGFSTLLATLTRLWWFYELYGPAAILSRLLLMALEDGLAEFVAFDG
jgi:hypothetical protein